ncbi:MAG: hypothetical protein B6242_12350 [Anaerolineaceae bacterium 4572_78]|nr:MAG: hypothetical protein B6242_12350 [Anaerolineaceae bacterium 4572_78]
MANFTNVDIMQMYMLRLALSLVFIMALVGLTWRASNELRGHVSHMDKSLIALCMFMVWNIIYVFTIANSLEFGEGCYMRIPIDPFLIIGFTLMLDMTVKRLFTLESQKP